MKTKLVASTEAQNNFGRVLDDIVQNSTRYIIRRRNASQAIILSISDFESILVANETERKKLEKVIRELSPVYSIGEAISERQV
jgi:PHD/YefM family antitoxin component YafN of YafNO toxin-antitoxin module